MFASTGCSSRMINKQETPESVEPIEPVESAAGVLPEAQLPEVSDMPLMPDETEKQNGNDNYIHQVVEAACGKCLFGMTEKRSCNLAVRIDGKSYFVDGTNIHEHGDAHADDGFCVMIRSASVKGEIIDGRFKSESFTLIK